MTFRPSTLHMAPGLALALALAAGPLAAQGAVARMLAEREAGGGAPATLVLLEARSGRALQDGFTALLRQEDLKAFQVPIRSYALGSGAERDFLARHRLEPRPQWLLVSRKGDAVVARGEALPDAAGFAQALHQAGFRDRIKELRAYLREFPDMVEAREQLLGLLRDQAERTAQRCMGIEAPTPRELLDRGDPEGRRRALAAPLPVDLSKAKPLDPVQDLEAWSAFAQELDTAFRTGQWREMNLAWTREGRPLDAASPTLRVLYRRWQPDVEAALRRRPESEAFWDLWLWMRQGQGESAPALAPLLASLQPSPLARPEQWPPERVARTLLATARGPEDWRTLKALYLARWEGEPHTLKEEPPSPSVLGPSRPQGPDSRSALLDQDWSGSLEPLLECCLRSGDAHLAESLLLEALDGSHWAGLPAKGAALARRCGQPALAARWSALQPASQPHP